MLSALTEYTWAHTDRAAEASTLSAKEQRSNLLQLSTLCFQFWVASSARDELFKDLPLGINFLPNSKYSLAIYMR